MSKISDLQIELAEQVEYDLYGNKRNNYDRYEFVCGLIGEAMNYIHKHKKTYAFGYWKSVNCEPYGITHLLKSSKDYSGYMYHMFMSCIQKLW